MIMPIIKALNQEFKSIIDFLNDNEQPSLSSDIDKHFKKVAVLSSASYFEDSIKEILIDFVSEKSGGNKELVNFFKKKAIGMHYHTFFDWGDKNKPNKPGKNANIFLSLFGEDFKKNVRNKIENDPDLVSAIKAFLEIGHLRNILVHSNFVSYNIADKTTDEIFALHDIGNQFIVFIKGELGQ